MSSNGFSREGADGVGERKHESSSERGHVTNIPSFQVGECVMDGEWKAYVLAPACGRGFYPVRRVFDDDARYAIVHGGDLTPSALSEDERQICGH